MQEEGSGSREGNNKSKDEEEEGFFCRSPPPSSSFLRSLLHRFNCLLYRRRPPRPASRHRPSVGCLHRLGLAFPISASSRPPHLPEEKPQNPQTTRRRRKFQDAHRFIVTPDAVPSANEAYDSFLAQHPAYQDTLLVDELREEEFGGLGQVFLDYSGHGLFSQLQRELDTVSSSFAVAPVAEPLALSAALSGSRATPEGTVESDVRRRIMRFLHIDNDEYGMVFAASKTAAFSLLAQSYPFDRHRCLFTVYDYESDAVQQLADVAGSRGAQILSATFSFPSLAVHAAELKAQIVCGSSAAMNGNEMLESPERTGEGIDEVSCCVARERSNAAEGKINASNEHEHVEGRIDAAGENSDAAQERSDASDERTNARSRESDATDECIDAACDIDMTEKGLFVFPVQSRVSGAKYSYQWMSLAQRHGWHVLLDASANDMSASLAFSLFRPDFIVASFYNVFGSDPTGFACLFVKNSAASALSATAATSSSAIVRLVALPESVSQPPYGGTSAAAPHGQVAFSGAVHSASIGNLSAEEALIMKGRRSATIFQATTASQQMPLESPPFSPAEAVLNGSLSQTISQVPTSSLPLSSAEVVLKRRRDTVSQVSLVSLPLSLSSLPSSPAITVLEDSLLKGKATVVPPLTPRSVLEEGLMGGRSSDSNVASTVGGSASSSCRSMNLTQNSIRSKPVHVNSAVSSDLGKAHDRRSLRRSRFWSNGRHSHDIGGGGHTASYVATVAAFSQPIDGRHKRLDGNLLPYGNGGEGGREVEDDDLDFSSSLYEDDDNRSSGSEFYLTDGNEDGWPMMRQDPEIYCRGLNHADALGRSKTNERLRYLIRWLVSSMQQLRHRVSEGYVPLVRVYGPPPSAAEHDRGASLAFNLFDREAVQLSTGVVKAVAREHGIYIGEAVLGNLRQSQEQRQHHVGRQEPAGEGGSKLAVLSASLGFFTNFEDVYRLWALAAKFLEPRFLERVKRGEGV